MKRSWESGRPLFWTGVIIAFTIGLCLPVLSRDSFPLSSDEAIHLMWLRLIDAGYVPYFQIYITYPPLYPLFLALAWALWPTLDGLRLITVVYILPLVIATGSIARRMGNHVAGIAAALLLVTAPQFIRDSRAILGELPSVMWGAIAIWLALIYRDSGRRLPLLLSGIALSCSLLTKLLSPFVLPLLVFIVLGRYLQPLRPSEWYGVWQRHKTVLFLDLLWLGMPILLSLGITFLLLEPSLLGPAVVQRLVARRVYAEDPGYWLERMQNVISFLEDNPFLILLAVCGLVTAFIRRLPYRAVVFMWLLMATLMLAFHNPLRLKHFVVLLPLLAILGSLVIVPLQQFAMRKLRIRLIHTRVDGVTQAQTSSLQQHDVSDRISKQLDTIPGNGLQVFISSIGMLLVLAPFGYTSWKASEWRPVSEPPLTEKAAIDFIKRVTTEEDCLITDSSRMAYWSGRMVPPELAEVSDNRLKTGQLTEEELIRITMRYDCQVVAAVSNRITKYFANYEKWVRSHYLGQFRYGEDSLYVAKAATTPQPAYPLAVYFGDFARLLGYTLSNQEVELGSQVALTLYWEAMNSTSTDYTIFVHGYDSAGSLRFTADHRPYDGVVPTTRWRTGAVIRDVVWIVLPDDLMPDVYSIWTGMYRLDTMERLSLCGDAENKDAVQLGHLKVLPRD
ncbi:MAG: glycosyltransferase family 39 protein [Candidatus Methanomethylicaceae archaeon]